MPQCHVVDDLTSITEGHVFMRPQSGDKAYKQKIKRRKIDK